MIEIGQSAAGKNDGVFKVFPAVSVGVADAAVTLAKPDDVLASYPGGSNLTVLLFLFFGQFTVSGLLVGYNDATVFVLYSVVA